jgi:hypothetical protein
MRKCNLIKFNERKLFIIDDWICHLTELVENTKTIAEGILKSKISLDGDDKWIRSELSKMEKESVRNTMSMIDSVYTMFRDNVDIVNGKLI